MARTRSGCFIGSSSKSVKNKSPGSVTSTTRANRPDESNTRMKPHQARSKNRSKPTSPQAATHQPVTVIFFERGTGKEMFRSEFPLALWKRVESASKQLGISAQELLEQAVNEKAVREQARFESPSAELNMACCQSNALVQLIAESMDDHNQRGHWTEKFGEEMCAGILELAAATRERLNRAVDAMDKALMAKESGVAA